MGVTKKTYRELIIGKLSDHLSPEVSVELANEIIAFGEEHDLLVDKKPRLAHHIEVEKGKITSSVFEEVTELKANKIGELSENETTALMRPHISKMPAHWLGNYKSEKQDFKQFMVFAHDTHYPVGGLSDVYESFDTLAEAKKEGSNIDRDFVEIYDRINNTLYLIKN